MIKSSIIFLLYLNISVCFFTIIDHDVSETDAENFPWMVVIKNSKSATIAYGSIIHQSAVLTLARMEYNEESYFNFRVYGGCFSTGTEFLLKSECLYNSSVNEYIIIEDDKDNKENNLAILILSQPIQLHPLVNIVEFSISSHDFSPDFCIVLSLRTMIKRNIDQSISRTATLFSSVAAHLYNKSQIKINLPFKNLSTIDERGRTESFERYLHSSTSNVSFAGSPVMCRVADDFSLWYQIGVANLVLKRLDDTQDLTFIGNIIKTNDDNTQGLIEDLVRDSTFEWGPIIGYK